MLNKVNRNKYISISVVAMAIALIPLIGINSGIDSFGFSTGVVKLRTELSKKRVNMIFSLQRGYGLQKDGPHEIAIYKISKKKFSSKDGPKGVTLNGKLVRKVKPVKFSGSTAKADKEYFSKVNPYKMKLLAKKSEVYAVSSKIYYCSFSDKFCSVEVIEKFID